MYFKSILMVQGASKFIAQLLYEQFNQQNQFHLPTTPFLAAYWYAFSPTAAAPVLTSWVYQNLPLFSFVLHSFLP